MGQREGLSYADETKINRMYKCNSRPARPNGHRPLGTRPYRRPTATVATGARPTDVHSTGSHPNRPRPLGTYLGHGIDRLLDNYANPAFWQRIFSSWAYLQQQPPFTQFGPYFAAPPPPPYGFWKSNSSGGFLSDIIEVLQLAASFAIHFFFELVDYVRLDSKMISWYTSSNWIRRWKEKQQVNPFYSYSFEYISINICSIHINWICINQWRHGHPMVSVVCANAKECQNTRFAERAHSRTPCRLTLYVYNAKLCN